MEDNKKIYKFYGKLGEDFHLWAARTDAAMKSKEVYCPIESDLLLDGMDSLSGEMKKAIADSCALVIQGLGDRPLRLCLGDKDDPFRIWRRLRDRYAVSNTATRVQLQSKLSRMCYTTQAMGDYIDAFEEIFNRLAGMGSVIDEDMQIALLLSSLGDSNRSRYGHIIISLQTVRESLSWETVTARLLQAFGENVWQTGNGMRRSHPDGPSGGPAQALTVIGHTKRRFQRKRNTSSPEKRRCYECRQIGHHARNCPQQGGTQKKTVNFREHQSGDGGSSAAPARLLFARVELDTLDVGKIDEEYFEEGNEQEDHDMMEDMLDLIEPEGNEGISIFAVLQDSISSRKDSLLLDSGASDHKVPHLDWLCQVRKTAPRRIILGDGRTLLSDICGTMKIQGEGNTIGKVLQTTLHNVMHVPDLSSGLLSVAKLCDQGYEVQFGPGVCQAYLTKEIALVANHLKGVYEVDAVPVNCDESFNNRATVKDDA